MKLPPVVSALLPRKFARQQKVPVPLGRSGRQVRIHVKWILLLVLGLFVAASLALVVNTKIFTVQQIEVVELVDLQPSLLPIAEIQASAKVLQDRSLLLINSDQLAEQWQQQYPTVKQITITKTYPHTLRIAVLPKVPLCQLVTPNGNFLVDRTGSVIAAGQLAHLPTMTTDDQSIAVGQNISVDSLLLGLALVDGLRGLQPKLESIVLHSQQLDIQLAGPPFILVGSGHSAEVILHQLQVLMSRFEAEQRYPREVDFRYDRPILRY